MNAVDDRPKFSLVKFQSFNNGSLNVILFRICEINFISGKNLILVGTQCFSHSRKGSVPLLSCRRCKERGCQLHFVGFFANIHNLLLFKTVS